LEKFDAKVASPAGEWTRTLPATPIVASLHPGKSYKIGDETSVVLIEQPGGGSFFKRKKEALLTIKVKEGVDFVFVDCEAND
jgi:hypothetical protein